MRAATWQGTHLINVETVPDPEIVNPRDCIVKVTQGDVPLPLHLIMRNGQ